MGRLFPGVPRPQFHLIRDCGSSEKLWYLPGFPHRHIWRTRRNVAGVVVFSTSSPASPSSPEGMNVPGMGQACFEGAVSSWERVLSHQRMLLVIISETKEFRLPGHHSGSTHHQSISLKMSTEMKNKMAIKSFITVHVQWLFLNRIPLKFYSWHFFFINWLGLCDRLSEISL